MHFRLSTTTTDPMEVFTLIQSPPVPKTMWHPEDVDQIEASLESLGEGSGVYLRSDNTLTVLGAPITA